MVQARDGLPPGGGRAQDGHRADDGAGNCGMVSAAANIKRPEKAALADLIGTINSSLRNHEGKGVQRANEGSPAKWVLI
jgi:hypothetical protein